MFWYTVIKTSELEKILEKQKALIKIARMETKTITPQEGNIVSLTSIYKYNYPECIIQWEIWCDEKYRYIELIK